jgi:hypothetical protein
MASAPDAAQSSSVNRRRKIYTDSRKTTYDAFPTCLYTKISKGTAAAESSLEQNTAQWWCSMSRKGMVVKRVGDGVLLLHKQEENIGN